MTPALAFASPAFGAYAGPRSIACASIYDADLAYTFGLAAAHAAGFYVISFPAAGRDGYG